jgi:UDP-N-acetylmuramoylalanine--D-glutamate ligase
LIDALARTSMLPNLASFSANPVAYIEAARGFAGLAHRCELIAEIDGVRYVNDSKATNVGACVAALEGLGSHCRGTQPSIILLAGGQGKSADFSPLAAPMQQHTKLVLLFGEDAMQLDAALPADVARAHSSDLCAAVVQAQAAALPGDLVLLAPACASFDMFDNFGARGEAFRRCVESLR